MGSLSGHWGTVVVAFCVLVCPSTQAEIATDGTVGPKGPLRGPDFQIPHSKGTIKGGNLFHSFDKFSIRQGQSATFTGPSGLDNVISRVTGDQPSDINGTLRSLVPEANFWFINPNGVTFGPHANIDVPAAFHVSTADRIKFSNGDFFSALDTAGSELSVAAPEAFRFLGPQPAALSIKGSTLAVREGKTLSIVAGDLSITNEGGIHAPSGKVEIASVGTPLNDSGGTVGVSTSGTGHLHADGFADLGKVRLTNFASVSASAENNDTGGGTVAIRGGRLVVENSFISADTVNADNAPVGIDISISGDVILSDVASIASDISSFGSGNAGDVRINADSLSVTKGSRLGSASIWQGTGDPGKVSIAAKTVAVMEGAKIESSTGFKSGGIAKGIEVTATEELLISGDEGTVYFSDRTGIFSEDGSGGPPFLGFAATEPAPTPAAFDILFSDGGPITIDAPSINMENGYISTITELSGGADINISGAETINLGPGSRISSKNLGLDTGGMVRIDASESVTMKGPKTRIESTTTGYNTGQAGSVWITAPLVSVEEGRVSSGTEGAGDAGNVTVKADQITLRNLGTVKSGTTSTGDAGDIELTATDKIEIFGIPKEGPSFLATGVFSDTQAGGDAGQVAIDAPIIIMDGRAVISTQSNAIGGGRAGDVEIGTEQTDEVSLRSGVWILDNTFNAHPGGTITINSTKLTFDDALITTATSGQGRAGGVKISAKHVTIANGTRINAATSGTGAGGKIGIEADDLVIAGQGTSISTVTSFKDGTVDASEKGRAGDIAIKAPMLQLISGGRVTANSLGTGKGGSVQIQGGQLLLDGGTVSAIAYGKGNAGLIKLTADDLTLRNFAIVESPARGEGDAGTINIIANNTIDIIGAPKAPGSFTPTGVFASTQANGNAGRITVSAPKIRMDGRAVISTQSTAIGGGRAGNIEIGTEQTDDVSLRGGAWILNSTFNASPGGTVTINSTDLTLDDAQITTSTSGLGQAGDIEVSAQEVVLEGGGVLESDTYGPGKAGAIELKVSGTLDLRDGAQIVTDTRGAGVGGEINISADRIVVDGAGTTISANSISLADLAVILDISQAWNEDLDVKLRSPLGTEVLLFSRVGGSGQNFTGTRLDDRAGAFINNGSAPFPGAFRPEERLAKLIGEPLAGPWILEIKDNVPSFDGGELAAWSLEAGDQQFSSDSEPVTIPVIPGATGPLTVSSTLPVNADPGIKIQAIRENDGGDISLHARGSIRISDGATISAATEGGGSGGDITVRSPVIDVTSDGSITTRSTGVGKAGNVFLSGAEELSLNDARITTEALQADGGQIDIRVSDMIHLKHSEITTEVAGGAGNAGNIFIDPTFLILENSRIVANAEAGAGGNISIQAGQIIMDPDSLIDASSRLGISGRVTINGDVRDVTSDLEFETPDFADPSSLIAESCASQSGKPRSSLVRGSREGLPADPSGNLSPTLIADKLPGEIEKQAESPPNGTPLPLLAALGPRVETRGGVSECTK